MKYKAKGLYVCCINNPILDTYIYKVESFDGTKQELSANIITENMFTSIDEEDN